jgi:hypothetical protein
MNTALIKERVNRHSGLTFYRFDETRKWLWIVPMRCGSISIGSVIRPSEKCDYPKARELNASGVFTIGVIRHPFDRAVSALHSILTPDRSIYKTMNPALAGKRMLPKFDERLAYFLELDDPHVRPQAPALDGIRVDYWIRFEHLAERFDELRDKAPLDDLPHYHKSHRPEGWRGVCDWSKFMPWYEKDLALCPEWERT